MERRATEGRSEELARAVAAATQPLQERITWLEAELAARSAPPPAPPVRDDVLLIRGIGPKIAAILATHGVTSLRQIATFTEADIARIGPLLPVYPNRIVDDNWIEQARNLISGIA
jgi:predicted flap endonuclease-1-like 5' DNA nuclease